MKLVILIQNIMSDFPTSKTLDYAVFPFDESRETVCFSQTKGRTEWYRPNLDRNLIFGQPNPAFELSC